MTKNGLIAGAFAFLLAGALAGPALAGGKEFSNGCKGTADDPCFRSGFCSIQNSDWDQTVTADRSEKYDTQGWAGLCDMVHVALVQANCEPLDAQSNVTAYLGDFSSAVIPVITGTLACGGEIAGDPEVCGDGIDNDGDGKVDEKPECRKQ
jgi:hypothetical protein